MNEELPTTAASLTQIEVYQLYAGLREVSPAVWRRVLVRSDSTIYDLHYTLQLAFGWSDSHLNRFLIGGRPYGVAKTGGCLFWNEPEEIKLADLNLHLKQRFIYEYDFYDHWLHDLRLENKLTFLPNQTYPICTGGRGRTPPEDCGGALSYLLQLQEYSLVYINLRMSEILDQMHRALQDETVNIREVYLSYQPEVECLTRWLQRHSNTFDRAAVNSRLAQFTLRDKEWWRGLEAEPR